MPGSQDPDGDLLRTETSVQSLRQLVRFVGLAVVPFEVHVDRIVEGVHAGVGAELL